MILVFDSSCCISWLFPGWPSWVDADADGTALVLSPRTTIRCTSLRSKMSRAGRRSLGKRQCNVSRRGLTLASWDGESRDSAFCGGFGCCVLCVLGGSGSVVVLLGFSGWKLASSLTRRSMKPAELGRLCRFDSCSMFERVGLY
jgi:hypothetical protein